MFSRCPNPECATVYRVSEASLRASMGMIRCVKCRAVFNAMAGLEPDRPDEPVVPLGDQLPIVRVHGDREVADPRMLQTLTMFIAPQSSAAEDEAGPPVERSHARRPEEAQFREIESAPRSAAEIEDAAPPPRTWRERLAEARELLPTRTDFMHSARNLLRHRRRTLMGLLAISFGVIAVTIAGGFIEWSKWFLRETTILAHLGHIQVVKKDYFERGEADPAQYVLPAESPVLEALEAMPEIVAVAPRLSFSGLISIGDSSVTFLGEGVMPGPETRVSERLTINAGQGLSDDRPDGIILGKGLAASLGLGPGATVVLLATPGSGGIAAVEAEVLGTFQTGSKAYDDVSLRVPLPMARQLARTEGSHRWVLLLESTEATDEVLATLRERFRDQTDIEFVPWLDLADFYKKSAALFSAQVNVVWAVIGLIIVVSISNTLIMNVVERTAEIGTLMALGLKRRRIMALFLNEGFLLGAAGGTVGALLGFALAWLISSIGIPLPPAPGMDFPVIGEIMVSWPLALGSFALGMVSTVIASVYPARKASRLEIVDALRHSR